MAGQPLYHPASAAGRDSCVPAAPAAAERAAAAHPHPRAGQVGQVDHAPVGEGQHEARRGVADGEDGIDLVEILAGIAFFGLHLLAAATAIAALELVVARMRVFRVVEFLGAAFILAVLAVVFRFVTEAS